MPGARRPSAGPERLAAPGSVAGVPTPDFVTKLRTRIGHDLLWLSTATALVFDAEGHVLLARRADNGRWGPPGGIIDPAEEPADAAVREAFEETGVVAIPERLVAVGVLSPITYPNGDHVQYLDLMFRCRAAGGEAGVNDSESVEVGWFPLDALPSLSERTLHLLKQAISGTAATAFTFSGVARVLGD
jgi:8-oxo-dGTP pyrophosphatase MutT (NUDIX family)